MITNADVPLIYGAYFATSLPSRCTYYEGFSIYIMGHLGRLSSVYSIISKLLEEISVLLRRVSSVGLPQGGKLPVDSSGRLGKWPLRDCEILRSSRCGEYYKSFYLNYLLSLARGPVAVSSWAGAGPFHRAGNCSRGCWFGFWVGRHRVTCV